MVPNLQPHSQNGPCGIFDCIRQWFPTYGHMAKTGHVAIFKYFWNCECPINRLGCIFIGYMLGKLDVIFSTIIISRAIEKFWVQNGPRAKKGWEPSVYGTPLFLSSSFSVKWVLKLREKRYKQLKILMVNPFSAKPIFGRNFSFFLGNFIATLVFTLQRIF